MNAPDPTRPGADRPDVRTVTDAQALSAMANPWRSRILDVLAVDGPATASQLAERTGLAVGSASHHLKVLDQAGLVEEARDLARDKRERWWRLVSRSTRWSRSEFADDAGAVTAALAAESLALQRQYERARDWLGAGGDNPEWEAAAFATQTWLKLSPEELADLSREVLALIDRWRERLDADADRPDRRPILIFTRGFPADP